MHRQNVKHFSQNIKRDILDKKNVGEITQFVISSKIIKYSELLIFKSYIKLLPFFFSSVVQNMNIGPLDQKQREVNCHLSKTAIDDCCLS